MGAPIDSSLDQNAPSKANVKPMDGEVAITKRKSNTDRGLHSIIGFFASTIVHVTVILTVGMIIINRGGISSPVLQLSMMAPESGEEMTAFDISTHSLADSPEPSEQPDIEIDAASQANTLLTSLSDSGTIAEGDLGPSDASDQFAAAATLGGGSQSSSSDPKSKLRASFFGAEAYGNKFVFVIDSSGSMRGPRWQALCKELIRAIQSLSPDQQFFIISFDSTAHPMFGKAPPYGKFLTPTAKNITRVQNWIRSIEHGRQTFPASAVGIAMRLEPDAIFLLSDGEINDSTVSDLRIWNRKQDEHGYEKTLVPIHTVLLHSNVGYATLETIANENSGSFTPVEPE
jgi:hypothetical protein